MSAALRVLSAGPGVTVQDAGRQSYMRFGVTPAGPMDFGAFAAALQAAGEPQGAAVEVSLGGLELAAEHGEIGIAVAGGAFDVRLDGSLLPPSCALTLAPGARLSLRAGPSGAWAYVAPCGRFDLPLVLGSLATHTRARLGGFFGRGLEAGDRLALLGARAGPSAPMAIDAPWLAPPPGKIRVLLGPQADFFAPETIAAFLAAPWRLSPRSDRMAYRLEGPPLAHLSGHDIVSDGLTFGAIQVPGDGAPLVLMADRQPTGGYPKIAHVIGADLGALAQKRAGEVVRFAEASWEEAVTARRWRAELIGRGASLTPLSRREFSSEFLLSQNLISGAVSAQAPAQAAGQNDCD
ncbi:MAG TPA: biotin-dependent carboxyltransferase family protein [Methylocystis sp.]|nr:biotin-dependent carboxyltransferase family protein [Methylocystis sp.]